MISDIASGPSSRNIYLNVVIRINEDYAELIEHLKEMDTRVAYLKTFELSLSTALPKPMTVYELVMRDEGLIGTRQQAILGLDDESEEVRQGERQRVPV